MKVWSVEIILFVCFGFCAWVDAQSCNGRCGDNLDSSFSCQCNSHCSNYNDCCQDYGALCLGHTCDGKCGQNYDPGSPCQCNTQCTQYGDCCWDYGAKCEGHTCEGRCGQPLDTARQCQCNSHCTRFGDCCSDYHALCESEAPPPTCLTTQQVTELLWNSDVNGLRGNDVIFNVQSQVPDSNTAQDASPQPLFSYVNSHRLVQATYPSFLELLDNYNPYRGQLEPLPVNFLQEEQDFLSAILDTSVMNILLEYARCRGWASSKDDLRQLLQTAWFDTYPRSGSSSIPDTSGFEHVMVGEYKSDTQVTGFHNWLAFYEYEKAGDLNYYGYVRNATVPDVIGAGFEWNGRYKALGSFLVGASPELDIALYSLAFWNSPGEATPISLGGHVGSIQTYAKDGHIATGFYSL